MEKPSIIAAILQQLQSKHPKATPGELMAMLTYEMTDEEAARHAMISLLPANHEEDLLTMSPDELEELRNQDVSPELREAILDHIRRRNH